MEKLVSFFFLEKEETHSFPFPEWKRSSRIYIFSRKKIIFLLYWMKRTPSIDQMKGKENHPFPFINEIYVFFSFFLSGKRNFFTWLKQVTKVGSSLSRMRRSALLFSRKEELNLLYKEWEECCPCLLPNEKNFVRFFQGREILFPTFREEREKCSWPFLDENFAFYLKNKKLC